METPSNLLLKISKRLFKNLEDQEKFVEALINPKAFYPVYSGVKKNQKIYLL